MIDPKRENAAADPGPSAPATSLPNDATAPNARLAQRISAWTIDALVLITLFTGLPILVEDLSSPPWLRPVVLFGPLVFLEPLLIRFFGRTVGQWLAGTKVVLRPSGARPGIFRLTARYWLKVILGGMSVIYVLFDPERRAIHDLLNSTQVLNTRGPISAASEVPGGAHPGPSAVRRFVVFLLWYVAAVSVWTVALAFVVVFIVDDGSDPGRLEDLFASFTSLSAVLIFVALAWAGAEGYLPGARVKKQVGVRGYET